MLPLLEELEISECYRLCDSREMIEAVAKSCPHLKHFRLIDWVHRNLNKDDGEAMAMAAGMRELRSLELHSNGLTSVGLMAILDNCAHLELLITQKCPHLKVDDALLAKCARVKTVILRGDEYGCYKVGKRRYYYGYLSDRCSICNYFSNISEMAEED